MRAALAEAVHVTDRTARPGAWQRPRPSKSSLPMGNRGALIDFGFEVVGQPHGVPSEAGELFEIEIRQRDLLALACGTLRQEPGEAALADVALLADE